VVNESTVSILADQRGTAEQPTLSMLGITKHYDGVAALTDVAFDVLPGEVHALLGENGAGKSTLMNIASGATTADAGTIIVDGAQTDSLTPALAQGLGIAMVHQHPALLPDMTVGERKGAKATDPTVVMVYSQRPQSFRSQRPTTEIRATSETSTDAQSNTVHS